MKLELLGQGEALHWNKAVIISSEVIVKDFH